MNQHNDDSYRQDDAPPAGATPPPPPPRVRPGLAWERRAELGPGAAALQTTRDVVFAPARAFADMRVDGGWAEPLGFAVAIGSIFIWVAQAWDMLTRSLLIGMPGVEAQDVASANTQEIWFALLAPFIVVVSTFFAAAIIHLLLIMFGGAPRPYETTFRVICYSWAVGVFNLVPICGVLIGGLWRIGVQVIGIREAQEVPTGRAAAAVIVPVILACLCLLFLTIAVIGLAGLAELGVQ